MITSRQKKGVILGIIWSFIAWVPYYTEHLGRVRAFIGVPATLGLNLELALNLGTLLYLAYFWEQELAFSQQAL